MSAIKSVVKGIYKKATGKELVADEHPVLKQAALAVLGFFPKQKAIKIQNARFDAEIAPALQSGKLMVFTVPAADAVSGGLMSISNIVERSKKLKSVHGYDVIVVTEPGMHTIADFTKFDNDMHVFRFSQVEKVLDRIDDLFLHVCDVSVSSVDKHITAHPNMLNMLRFSRLNILNQNTQCMPDSAVVKHLANFFDEATQTCAHTRYCTKEYSELYDMPLHLLTPQIPTVFYPKPFSEKENVIAYSPDPNEHRDTVLERLASLLPDYGFLMIHDMTYDEYKRTIGRVKWVLTFGEGWDGFFLEPYWSNSVGLTVFNPLFCPERMKSLPTVFADYETLPERMAALIRENDNEESYSKLVSSVPPVLFPPSAQDAPYIDQLEELYRGHYAM